MELVGKVSSQIFKLIIVESRTKLKSLNVMITLKGNFAEECNIGVSSSGFVICKDNRKEQVNFHFEDESNLELLPDSLIIIYSKNEHLVFRCSLTSKSINGSFATEVLYDRFPTYYVSPLVGPGLTNCEYNLVCLQCSRDLGNIFLRDIIHTQPPNDTDDWFCHSHSTYTPPDMNGLIIDDQVLLFHHSWFFISPNVLKNSVIKKGKCLSCKHCNTCLGDVAEADMHHLWFNTVGLTDGDGIFKSCPLTDVLNLLSTLVGGSIAHSKIILDCKVGENEMEFLLLWVLEANLMLAGLPEDETNVNFLSHSKVLYKYETKRTETVTAWYKDMNTGHFAVSKLMLDSLVDYLRDFNNVLPPEFGASNGFYVSYLKLDMYDRPV